MTTTSNNPVSLTLRAVVFLSLLSDENPGAAAVRECVHAVILLPRGSNIALRQLGSGDDRLCALVVPLLCDEDPLLVTC